MFVRIKPLPFKPPKLRGLDRALLDTHFEQHYGSRVRALNATITKLAGLKEDAAPTVRRELAHTRDIQLADVELHELFFANITDADDTQMSSTMSKQLIQDFGSVEQWKSTLARDASDTSGWLLVRWSSRLNQIIHQQIDDQNIVDPSDSTILAIDLSDHAYTSQFGSDAHGYVGALLTNTNWAAVSDRFSSLVGEQSSVTQSADAYDPEELKSLLQAPDAFTLLDVRHRDDLPSHEFQIQGSRWVNSQNVDAWIDKVDRTKPVVVYCVYGAWVSEGAAKTLRDAGLDARILRGGISSWVALDLPTQSISPAAAMHDESEHG